MVTIGGEKMSKSLGNFTTVADALADARSARVPAGRAADALPARRWISGPTELDRGGEGGRAPRRAVPARRRRRGRTTARPPTPGRSTRFRAAMDDDFDTAHGAGGASSRPRGDAEPAIDDGDDAPGRGAS